MVTQFASPFAALQRLQHAMDGAYSSDWFGTRTSSYGEYPPINIFQSEDDYVLVAEMPGARKEDLDIQVKDRRVRIRGRKSLDFPEKASVHRRERSAGEFDRTFSFPVDLDPDRSRAELDDGILAVYIARAEKEKPRSISIN